MGDTNLAVKMLALGIVAKVATGMGRPFEKHAKALSSAVATVCADQKATTRSAGLATLGAMADAAGLDSMYAGLATALESLNPILRSSILAWLAERLQADPPSAGADLAPLAAPILACLEDRNGDVRKAAGVILPFVVANAGFDFVMDHTSKLRPASKATIIPLIEKARTAASAAAPSVKSTSQPPISTKSQKSIAPRSAPGSPAPTVPTSKMSTGPARSVAMKALSSAPSTRPASASSHGDERLNGVPKGRAPTSSRPESAVGSVASSSSGRACPFSASSPEARPARLKKDAAKWILEPSSKNLSDLTTYLQAQFEPVVLPEICALLFSKDHRAEEDFIAALTILTEFFSESAATTFGMHDDQVTGMQLANVDLCLKYTALKLLLNNSQLANRCLELVSSIIDVLRKANERLSDMEAKLFVPALVFKVKNR